MTVTWRSAVINKIIPVLSWLDKCQDIKAAESIKLGRQFDNDCIFRVETTEAAIVIMQLLIAVICVPNGLAQNAGRVEAQRKIRFRRAHLPIDPICKNIPGVWSDRAVVKRERIVAPWHSTFPDLFIGHVPERLSWDSAADARTKILGSKNASLFE
jgi:hypothetical protein